MTFLTELGLNALCIFTWNLVTTIPLAMLRMLFIVSECNLIPIRLRNGSQTDMNNSSSAVTRTTKKLVSTAFSEAAPFNAVLVAEAEAEVVPPIFPPLLLLAFELGEMFSGAFAAAALN